MLVFQLSPPVLYLIVVQFTKYRSIFSMARKGGGVTATPYHGTALVCWECPHTHTHIHTLHDADAPSAAGCRPRPCAVAPGHRLRRPDGPYPPDLDAGVHGDVPGVLLPPDPAVCGPRAALSAAGRPGPGRHRPVDLGICYPRLLATRLPAAR